MDRRSFMRAAFRIVNSMVVVPAFRLKLGWVISNPLAGKVMVLGIRGRKTGRVRYTPVSFAQIGSSIYCYQGRETKGRWYLNILKNPDVEVMLPRGPRLAGHAELVAGEEERAAAIRQILINSGLNRGMYGFDPRTASEEVLRERTAGLPVVRIAQLDAKPTLSQTLNMIYVSMIHVSI